MSTPVSLMKVKSTQSKCWVFYQNNQRVEKFEVSVDSATTVSALISTVIGLIKSAATCLDLQSTHSLFELYASRKSGKQMSDLPSLQQKQTVLQTGLKFFLLKTSSKIVKAGRLSTVSTKSIQSEMKTTVTNQKEVKPGKNSGCFCF